MIPLPRRAQGYALLVCLTCLMTGGGRSVSAFGSQSPAKQVVIPFDFESKFDRGEYGQTIGDMLWMKLHRQGGFVIPETMQEVRDWSSRTGIVPGPDTPLERMKEIVTKEQAGDIAIWGKVERVTGNETDVYDLWIYLADFSADPPRIIYRKQARTRTVSEIPHVYVREALDRLYNRSTAVGGAVADPAVEERWVKNPNLVKGDFEQGQGSPTGWDRLPRYASWAIEQSPEKAKNRVIRFTMDEVLAGNAGALYYSDFFPVDEGATYRFQCRWQTTGSAAKVFIKCYDELPSGYRTRPVPGSQGDPLKAERREVYRSQQNLEGKPGAWNTHSQDFTPQHTQFSPRWGRVMLYAYWPAGRVSWDDVVVKQVVPPPASKVPKDRRPSLETRIRTRELEEAGESTAKMPPRQRQPARRNPAPTRGATPPE